MQMFQCPNIGQVTLTLLVQGFIVSSVNFFVQQFWWLWTWAKLVQLVCIILLPVTQRPAENPCDGSGWHLNVVREKSTARVSCWKSSDFEMQQQGFLFECSSISYRWSSQDQAQCEFQPTCMCVVVYWSETIQNVSWTKAGVPAVVNRIIWCSLAMSYP